MTHCRAPQDFSVTSQAFIRRNKKLTTVSQDVLRMMYLWQQRRGLSVHALYFNNLKYRVRFV